MSEYLILIYDAEAPYATFRPEQWREVGQSHQRFVEHVGKSGGKILGSRALQPIETAVSIRGGQVSEGPFVQTTESFCGYYLIEANDDGHAREIAKRCPAKFGGVEVRPIRPTSVSA